MFNLQPELDRLEQIRIDLSAQISSFEQEAMALSQLCDGEEELIEHIAPITKALTEMLELTQHRLPSKNEVLDTAKKAQIEDIYHFQRKFVHDLRNPLGVVLGYSELVDEMIEEYSQPSKSIQLLGQKLRWLAEQLQKFNQYLNIVFPNQNHHIPNIQNKTPIPTRQESALIIQETPVFSDLPNQLIPHAPAPSADMGQHRTFTQSTSLQDNQKLQNMITAQQTPSELIPIAKKKHVNVHREAKILVVDDNDTNRKLLCSMLDREGYVFIEANSGEKALEIINEKHIDLVLLDFIMQGLSGLDVLTQIKSSHFHKNIAVIMISGDTELDTVIKSIELGAEDYLSKPFNSFLLKARIGACLEKKRLLDELEEQNLKFETLLNRILPTTVVKRMSQGESTIADQFDSTSILFSDIVGFTKLSSQLNPNQVINVLNAIFMEFDTLAERLGIEKIKTIGDAYMAAAGVPMPRQDHADVLVEFGLAMIKSMDQLCLRLDLPLKIRVGIHSGPVAGGIIGQSRFLYDIWGDTVNMASRLEASGEPGAVHISTETLHLLSRPYQCKAVGGLELKGKGFVHTYLITPI